MTNPGMSHTKSARPAAAAALLASVLAACAADGGGQPGGAAGAGAAVGAALGGIAGAVLDKNDLRGPVLGAAAGAALGGGLGYLLDQRRRELERAVEPQRAAGTAAVEPAAGDGLRVAIEEEAAFEPGSAVIRPDFLPTLERVADVLERDTKAAVTVVYHAREADARLAHARAAAVRDALATYGIDPARARAEVRPEGGEAPGAVAGREVEILVTPAA